MKKNNKRRGAEKKMHTRKRIKKIFYAIVFAFLILILFSIRSTEDINYLYVNF